MIAKRFEQQVKKNPNKLAVKTGRESITYNELNRYANRIAHRIRERCSRPSMKKNGKVGLLFEEAIDMIAAIIGVLKLGKVYVPLSPDYPAGRLSYMISHSEVSLILKDFNNQELAKKLVSDPIIENASAEVEIEEINHSLPGPENNPEREDSKLMYILYTSGSTGKPKGVMQTQGNVLYFIDQYTKNLAITGNDRMTLFSSFTHDAAVMDLYGALLNGATLYPMNILKLTDLAFLSRWLEKERINIWHSVPTVYRYFANSLRGEETFPDLRLVVLGGEAVIKYDIDMFHKRFPHTTLYNLYGQSESSYNSGMFIKQGDLISKITLGKVVDGTEIFVVDDDGNDVDTLETGEIIIASPYVSPGYWKDHQATKKSFQPDPENGRLYRTGDIGCLLLDGRIEFTSRKDSQVKIRGQRVELGEIESLLLMHDNINDAAVIAVQKRNAGETRGVAGDRYIAAYIVSARTFNTSQLREYLASRLPDYMIPSYFIQLDSFPRTRSGKIDRKALPEPKARLETTYAPPGQPLEEELVEIWAELLGIEKEIIGIDSNFFAIGGHSLKAITLASQIHKRLNVKLSLADIFKTPTIRGLAGYIKEAAKEVFVSIKPMEKKDYYALSSAQKRLYILQRLNVEDISYNMSEAFELEGKFSMEKFRDTFQKLIKRHESLRTAFVLVNQEPAQRIHREVDFKINYFDLSLEGKDVVNSQERKIIRDFIKPFELSKAPLLRVGMIKVEEERNILMVDTHHIISDGISQQLLTHDFMSLYAGEALPELRLQYKEYAEWWDNAWKRETVKPLEEYWLNEFGGEIPVLNMPHDFVRVPLRSFKGNGFNFRISKEETKALKKISLETDATLYIVLLTVYYILLSKISGQEDIVVGIPIAGRNYAGLEHIIGMFVNMLALRNYPKEEMTFKEFLDETRKKILKAFENQDYQFDDLVKQVVKKRDLSRNPLFDVAFSSRNLEVKPGRIQTGIIPEKEAAKWRLKQKKNEHFVSAFDINFVVVENKEDVFFAVEYATALFKKSTIEEITKHYIEIIKQIIKNLDIKIMDISISHNLSAGKTVFSQEEYF